MKVLVLSSVFPNPSQPGLGIFVRERIRHVARHCEVEVVAPIPWFPLNRWLRGARWAGIPAVEAQGALRVHHPAFLSVPRYAKALDGMLYFASILPVVARLRRRFPFDLIDAHFAYPDGMAAVLLGRTLGVPVTVTLRGTIVPLSRFLLRRGQIRWTLARAARVIAVSESLKRVAEGLGIPGHRIRVIPNGVDTTRFHSMHRGEARQALRLPLDRPILMSVGGLSPRKGHQRVIEPLPQVLAARPDLLYVVVGGPGPEGDTAPLLRRLTSELGLQGHVLLTGPRPHDEIPRWLAAADCFCLATTNEGCANALLEALACGVPVVSTRVGGNAEIVTDPRQGVLVPPEDADALSSAIVATLARRLDPDEARAWGRVRSWSLVAEQVMEEICLAVGGRACSRPLDRLGAAGRDKEPCR